MIKTYIKPRQEKFQMSLIIALIIKIKIRKIFYNRLHLKKTKNYKIYPTFKLILMKSTLKLLIILIFFLII